LLTKQLVKFKFDPSAKDSIGITNIIETMLIEMKKRTILFLL